MKEAQRYGVIVPNRFLIENTTEIILKMIISKASYLLAAAGLALLIPSCNQTRYPEDNNVFIRRDGPPRYGWRGTQTPQPDGEGGTKDQKPRDNRGQNPQDIHEKPDTPEKPDKPEKPDVEDPSKPEDPKIDVKPPEVKPKSGTNLPFGVPVIGEKGYVYSPYAPDKGKVDVTGIPSNTKVECPYTQKIFRVP